MTQIHEKVCRFSSVVTVDIKHFRLVKRYIIISDRLKDMQALHLKAEKT